MSQPKSKIYHLLCLAVLLGAVNIADGQQSASSEMGTLHGDVHMTSGNVSITSSDAEGQKLHLSGFKTMKGPALHMLLIASDDAADDQSLEGGSIEEVDLGKLKGLHGNQTYTIPAGTDLSKFRTAVVYCKQAHKVFGAAPLHKP